MITKSLTKKLLYFPTNPESSTIYKDIIVNEADRMILIGDTVIESDIIVYGEVLCI